MENDKRLINQNENKNSFETECCVQFGVAEINIFRRAINHLANQILKKRSFNFDWL